MYRTITKAIFDKYDDAFKAVAISKGFLTIGDFRKAMRYRKQKYESINSSISLPSALLLIGLLDLTQIELIMNDMFRNK